MSQYLLINRIQVQGANAVAGFTWGFPAITHFLGFSHNLSRKLQKSEIFSDIHLSGCAVIAHQQQVHTYGYNQFIQSKNPAYLKKDVAKVQKGGAPSIIEEGKMNMNVSLLLAYEGNIGNREEALIEWLNNTCICQRLAGGSILEIGSIQLFTVDDEKNRGNLKTLVRRLLPGFVLQDRSQYLEDHFNDLQDEKPDVELFDAWLDFIALKQQARPASDLINRHLVKQADLDAENEQHKQLLKLWQEHLDQPYEQENIPDDLKAYFSTIPEKPANKKLLAQWQTYCVPNDNSEAVWEYVKKPNPGFLVPIMVGYKAISKVYQNDEVANTRDHETDVCFVEAVHSVGEWQGAHRIRDEQALKQSLWHYDDYQEHWYLCRQNDLSKKPETSKIFQQDPNDDFF